MWCLQKKYPGKTIIEINDCVFGTYIGKIFSSLYIFFFFSLAFLNANNMSGFVSSYVLPDTPTVVILFMFMFVCAWSVRKRRGNHNTVWTDIGHYYLRCLGVKLYIAF